MWASGHSWTQEGFSRREPIDARLLVLLQRFAHYLTRVVIDVDTLHESVEHVLEEADLLEEWTRARWDSAADPVDLVGRSEEEFDGLMGREVAGTTLRRALRDPKLRATVRRTVAAELVD